MSFFCETCEGYVGDPKNIGHMEGSKPPRMCSCIAQFNEGWQECLKQHAEQFDSHKGISSREEDRRQRRDEFAKAALTGVINEVKKIQDWNPDMLAKVTVLIADAVIAELDKGGV